MTSKVLRSIVFLIIGIFIISYISKILQKAGSDISADDRISLAYKNRNYYDVLVLGASQAFANTSNQELYEKYGIAALSLASPKQFPISSYYTLKEAFTVQKPKIVIYDSTAIFYTPKLIELYSHENNEYNIHESVDNLRNLFVKWELIDELKKINPDINPLNYKSSLYFYHNYWKNVKESSFSGGGETYKRKCVLD